MISLKFMKGKNAEERVAVSSGKKSAPEQTEKTEKQAEAPKKANGKQEKPKESEQPKRQGRPPKENKDNATAARRPASLPDMPCIVRNLTDDEVVMQIVEDNLNQHEEILPNEMT